MNIYEKIKTKQELESFVENINKLEFALFGDASKNVDVENILDSKFDYKFAQIVNEWLSQNDLNSRSIPTKVALQEAINAMKTALGEAALVHITLSFVPTQKFVSQMYRWAKTNIHEKVILDISCDNSILGGLIISYNGKYLDLSLNKALPEVISRINI